MLKNTSKNITKPIKILCFIEDLCSGGAQRQLVNLAIEYKKKGHDVNFLVYFPNDYYYPILKQEKIKIYNISEEKIFSRIKKVRQHFLTNKYDVIISFLQTPNLISEICSINKKSWKLVVSERSYNPKLSKSIKTIFFKFFHIFADKIIFNSFANKKQVSKVTPYIRKSKKQVIYNLIDTIVWSPDNNYKVRVNKVTKLVIAATHRSLKNFNGLIEAIYSLSAKDKEQLSVEWYGDRITEPYYDNSLPKAKKLINKYNLENTISILPATNNIKEKIQSADVIGLFSFYEGLPNVVCEAMACQKPVIATKVSDVPMLIDDNIGGFLSNPNDINSIKISLEKIINLSNIDLQNMGKHNRQKAMQLFDKDKVLNSFL